MDFGCNLGDNTGRGSNYRSAEMHGGYRGLVLTLAALALAGAQHQNAHAQPQTGVVQERSYAAVEDSARTNSEQAEEAERSSIARECKPGDDQRGSDLCAQWKAADAAADSAAWAKLSAWISGISGLLVVGALGLAYHANWIARDTAKRQLRAYMGIHHYTLTPYIIGDGDTGRFLIQMQNFGQTPARRLTMIVSYALIDWVDESTKPQNWDFTSGKRSVDVAPGAHTFRNISFAEHALAHVMELTTGATVLWVKMEASYRDIFGRKHEQTTLFFSRETAYNAGTLLVSEQTAESSER